MGSVCSMTYEPPASTPSPDEPAMSPPATAPPPYVPQPPKQNSNWWKILIAIGAVVAVLCCIGAVGLGIWGYNKVKDVAGPAQDTVNAYLDDVQDGNYGAAYDRLCAGAKKQLTAQQFAQAQSMVPKITKHEITGFNVNTVNGKSTATVNVRLERELVGETNQTIQLVKEDGDWKVCQVGV
jgi:flagellar basal body-associated protein FliL